MIYADYNSSTPLTEEVKNHLLSRIKDGPFANPNSIHLLGQKINQALDRTRNLCSRFLGANPEQLIFNSGATEGVTTVFHSLLTEKSRRKRPYVIISAIEHSAVHNTAQFFSKKGFKLKILPVSKNGVINLAQLKKWLEIFGDKTSLVSIMAANNETGVVQPYQKIGDLCSRFKVPFFSDTTQLIGKTPFEFNKTKMDYCVMSGHKIGAMTGTGILIVKDRSKASPLLLGGGQESGLRSGTQNYIPIETLAVALNEFEENRKKLTKLNQLKENFEKKLKLQFPEVVIFGEKAPRLSNTSFISFPGIHAQAIQIGLESNDIFVSTSSACADNEPVTSRVLQAMGVDDVVGRGAIRISLGLTASSKDFDKIFKVLASVYKDLSKMASY